MIRIPMTAVVAMLCVMLAGPPATAASWEDYGKAKAGTKASFTTGYGNPGFGHKVRYHRNRGSDGRHQVTVRWRLSEDQAHTWGEWKQKSWQRIDRNRTLVRKGPRGVCYPRTIDIQAIVRVRTGKHWTKPKVIAERIFARISDC